MNFRVGFWVTSLLLALTGCGGSKGMAPRAGASSPSTVAYEADRGAPAARPGLLSEPGAEASQFAPRDTAAAPSASERPGLGTEWGETKASRVRDEDFDRSEEHTPFDLAVVRYDDHRGIEALRRSSLGTQSGVARIDMAGERVAVSLESGGSVLPALRVGSSVHALGVRGEAYKIVLRNRSPFRFEAVVTVDGLDVIDGKPGAFEKRGYIVAPFATVEVDGFRQNMNEVAAFRFGSVRDSYAAQTSGHQNVGVIGVALFAEEGSSSELFSPSEVERRRLANPFPAADGRFARPPMR